MTRRYISLAEAAEYLGVSTKTVRQLIADGRLTGYRLGPKLIRVDIDEIDEHLMRPMQRFVPDPRGLTPRSAAFHRNRQIRAENGKPAKTAGGNKEPSSLDVVFRRWCKCGHTAEAHGLTTTIAPGTINPPKIGVCWTCGECNQFDEDMNRRKTRKRRRA